MTLREKVRNVLTDVDDKTIISLWNEYCRSHNYLDDAVYYNNQEFFNEQFETPWEAIEATTYGHWVYDDPYVVFNGGNNLDSFYYVDDKNYSPIDYNDLTDFVIDRELFADIGLDSDELDDLESED